MDISEKSEQKSKRMTELENKVDRCLRRCDSDLERFGNEIELEQPGITEQLAENALNLEPQKTEPKKEYDELDEDDYTVRVYRRLSEFLKYRGVGLIRMIIFFK